MINCRDGMVTTVDGSEIWRENPPGINYQPKTGDRRISGCHQHVWWKDTKKIGIHQIFVARFSLLFLAFLLIEFGNFPRYWNLTTGSLFGRSEFLKPALLSRCELLTSGSASGKTISWESIGAPTQCHLKIAGLSKPYLRDHGGLHNPSIRTYKDSCPSKVLIDNLQRLNHDLRFANRDEQMSSLDDHFPYSLAHW